MVFAHGAPLVLPFSRTEVKECSTSIVQPFLVYAVQLVQNESLMFTIQILVFRKTHHKQEVLVQILNKNLFVLGVQVAQWFSALAANGLAVCKDLGSSPAYDHWFFHLQ